MEIKVNQTTIEHLQDSLNQALEERKLANQKIDDLKKTFQNLILQLQSMEDAVHASVVTPIATQAVPVVSTQTEQNQTAANIVKETIADVLKKVDGDATTETSTLFGKIFWSYIVPAVIMFVLIWFAMTYINIPGAKASSLPEQLSSKIEDVSFATLQDIQSAQELVEEPVKSENPEKIKVHLAIIGLVVDLNALDTQYVSGEDTELFFEQVTDKWHELKDLIQPEINTPEIDGFELDVPELEGAFETQDTASETIKPADMSEARDPVETRTPIKAKRGLFRTFR